MFGLDMSTIRNIFMFHTCHYRLTAVKSILYVPLNDFIVPGVPLNVWSGHECH